MFETGPDYNNQLLAYGDVVLYQKNIEAVARLG